MLKDVQNSIKAKLYDFTYSPFMSSMIISWIILNHKYILIYLASYDLDKKLSLLEKYDFTLHTSWFPIPYFFNIVLPILFGLFYTFLYPMASKKFYEHTLEKNKELKKIKQDIEDVTPVTQEEARTLRESITQLTENKYALEKKLIESEERYKKIDQESKKDVENRETLDHINPIQVEIETSPKIEKKKEEDDKTKFLRHLYESNYSEAPLNTLLIEVVLNTTMKRVKAEKIFDELLHENIMVKDDDGWIYISDDGSKLLLEMFDKEK